MYRGPKKSPQTTLKCFHDSSFLLIPLLCAPLSFLNHRSEVCSLCFSQKRKLREEKWPNRSQFSCEFSHQLNDPPVTSREHCALYPSSPLTAPWDWTRISARLIRSTFTPPAFIADFVHTLRVCVCVCFILHTVRVYKVEAGGSHGPVALRQAALTRTDQRRAKINRGGLI